MSYLVPPRAVGQTDGVKGPNHNGALLGIGGTYFVRPADNDREQRLDRPGDVEREEMGRLSQVPGDQHGF